MTEDTNLLSEAESKYFETGGKTDLPAPETAEQTEKPAETEKTEAVQADKSDKPADKKETIEVVDPDEVEDEPDGRRYVKVGALRKEREKTKQEKQARIALEQKIRDLEQRFQQAQNPPRQITAEELPHQTAQEVRELKNALAEQTAKQQFIATYQQKVGEFMKGSDDEPGVADFPEAYQHALGVRRAMYEMAGFEPQEVATLLESEEAAIVQRAMQVGKNPAQAIYDTAKKLGYQPKQAAKDDPVKEQVETQAKTADKTLEAAKKLEKIAKGMDKNKSLAGAGGGNEAPSLEELLDMDEAEFTKHTAGKKFQALMGG